MSFFKPKFAVCKKCGNHFDPLPKNHGEYMFRDLCAEHRKPEVDLYWRQQDVKAWVTANWLRLEEQMKTEQAAALDAAIDRRERQMSNLAANLYGQQAAAASNPYCGLGGLNV